LLVDGEELAFESAPAEQSHVWGKKHAYSWMWGHCHDFGDDDGLMEVLCTRLQRRGFTLPPLTILSLHEGGEHHRLNQFRHVVLNRGQWRSGLARFTAYGPSVKIVGELTCRPDQLVNAPYVDPDGQDLWCANTEIGDARLEIFRRGLFGWRAHKVLVGRGTAHFETGSRERDPSIQAIHRLC
jgi:hypothetical protein